MKRTRYREAIGVAVSAVLALVTAVEARQPRPIKPARARVTLPGVTDGPGWTSFSPSVDSRIVYVSARFGNDANDGLSAASPKQTLAAGYELMRDGFPDWLLLRRADQWHEAFPAWTKGGRLASEPMVIGSYGSGPRPLLTTASGFGFMARAYPDARAHLALFDIHFIADRSDGSSLDSGVTVLNHWSDVLIENCRIEGYRNNIVVEQLDTRPSNIRIRRCVVTDSFCTVGWFSQGIYAGTCDGLLVEENIFDHNGWRRGVPGANAIIFNHNMYLHDSCTGVVCRGNISARASATGISQRCAGICEDNLLLQNPTGVFYGGDPNLVTPARGALRNNIVFDARDIDSNSPRGFGFWIGGIRSAEIYGNIVAYHRSGSENIVGFNVVSELYSVSIARNLVYDWTLGSTGLCMNLDFRSARRVTVTDNMLAQPLGGFLIGHQPATATDLGRTFGRNRYFTSNTTPHQFYYGTSYPDWVGAFDEIYSTFGPLNFPDPNRDIAAYMTSLSLTPTLDAFMAKAREQERTTWDARFTSEAVQSYVRQGFGITKRGCRADFNDDGSVNALDLTAFQAAAAALDARADVDLDGAITTQDFTLFQAIFAAGCP